MSADLVDYRPRTKVAPATVAAMDALTPEGRGAVIEKGLAGDAALVSVPVLAPEPVATVVAAVPALEPVAPAAASATPETTPASALPHLGWLSLDEVSAVKAAIKVLGGLGPVTGGPALHVDLLFDLQRLLERLGGKAT